MLPGADTYKTGVENVIKHSKLIVMWDLAWESTYRLQASEIYEERRESGFIKKMEKIGLIMS